ncbi:MAG: hypothetical protein ACLU1S_08370 [Eubacterium sp.]
MGIFLILFSTVLVALPVKKKREYKNIQMFLKQKHLNNNESTFDWKIFKSQALQSPALSVFSQLRALGFRVPKNGDARNTKPAMRVESIAYIKMPFVTIELFRHYRRKEKVI